MLIESEIAFYETGNYICGSNITLSYSEEVYYRPRERVGTILDYPSPQY